MNGRSRASRVVLAVGLNGLVGITLGSCSLAACEKKDEAPVAPAASVPAVAAPVATPAAPVKVAPAPITTLAPTANVAVNGKTTPVRAVKMPDGGTVFLIPDGGVVDAATAQSLAQQAAALATAAGIQVPTTMPTVITIPTTFTLPPFPGAPGAPDAAK